MKPNNPMMQLQQWKDNHKAGKSAVKNFTFLKSKERQKTQLNEHRASKSRNKGNIPLNPLSFSYAQLTRQFKLILDSNRKCLDVYPEEFHHKIKFKEELSDLVERLKGGGKLFNAMAKSQGATFCRDNQATLSDFNQANGYLIHKFGEVIQQIEQLNLERVENEKLQGANNE